MLLCGKQIIGTTKWDTAQVDEGLCKKTRNNKNKKANTRVGFKLITSIVAAELVVLLFCKIM